MSHQRRRFDILEHPAEAFILVVGCFVAAIWTAAEELFR
mgnify:CR=1 FL=1